MAVKSNESSKLKTTKQSAKEKIQIQIDAGKALLLTDKSRHEDLEKFREDYYSWYEFNLSLIKTLFTHDDEVTAYDSGIYGSWVGERDPYEEMQSHNRDVSTKLRKLDSLIKRVDLFVELNPMDTSSDTINFWPLIHSEIKAVAKSRFDTGHFADSVEASMKEINQKVKTIYKARTGKELDGTSLMKTAFSANSPVLKLGDDTQTGKDIQQGYMELFSGSILAVRNPKAHDNITIDSRRAIHFLFLASLLMCKLDELR